MALLVVSGFGNCELDVVVEDESFARSMERAFLADLENSTELVVAPRRLQHAADGPRRERDGPKSGGSVGRAAAGAIRVGNAVGAAVANWRVLEPVEARLMATVGATLLGLALLVWVYPKALAYPAAVVCAWVALALLYRAYGLTRRTRAPDPEPEDGRAGEDG